MWHGAVVRCATITPTRFYCLGQTIICTSMMRTANTGWPRGDVHETFQGGHPPEDDDYKDHSAAGWGFLDSSDTFPEDLGSWFDLVAAQRTEIPLVNVKGGWHDAADFDRRDSHFGAVSDLVQTFLMFPEVMCRPRYHISMSSLSSSSSTRRGFSCSFCMPPDAYNMLLLRTSWTTSCKFQSLAMEYLTFSMKHDGATESTKCKHICTACLNGNQFLRAVPGELKCGGRHRKMTVV